MNTYRTLEEQETLARQVRRDIIRMVYGVQSGHPGGSLGCTEYFVSLFTQHLRHTPAPFSPTAQGEDLFILSNGHISPVYYSVLARTGYFPVAELATFRLLNSRLQGHPATHEHLPGIRIATGSLGQGVSAAAGAALAKRLDKDPHLVYALCGDGELQEGQIWEAVMFAAHNQIDNLVLTVDLNFKQIDGDTRDVLDTRDLAERFRAFKWAVLEEPNGNDMAAVNAALAAAKAATGKGKPVVLLLTTEMGKGVDYMEGTHEYHGKPPSAQGYESALVQLAETPLGDY